MGKTMGNAAVLVESRLQEAARGSASALYDLGMVFATGAAEAGVDLVAAHKWFNLAALKGDPAGQERRAEIAAEMSAREIAEAQRQARAWLSEAGRRLS